jgi:hypothetical protein
MRYPIAAMALVATSVTAQGVSSVIEPATSTPAGCDRNFPSSFEISITASTSAAKMKKRAQVCSSKQKSMKMHG